MSRVLCTACVGVVVALAVSQLGTAAHSAPVRTTPIVVHVDHNGFRLLDAAVGAIAGGGVALAVVGCVVLLRLRREEGQHRQKGAER